MAGRLPARALRSSCRPTAAKLPPSPTTNGSLRRWGMPRNWPAAGRVLELRDLAVDHLHPGRRRSRRSTSGSAASAARRSALGWPLVCLFSLFVAATMGQIASAFPTAGGLYHWAAILGGRGWGWVTAWFNLAGLVTVLAAINVGTFRFAMAAFVPDVYAGRPRHAIARVASDHRLARRHQPPRHPRDARAHRLQRLLDFARRRRSLTVALLAFAPSLDFVPTHDVHQLQRAAVGR